jgi:hypothetical protein
MEGRDALASLAVAAKLVAEIAQLCGNRAAVAQPGADEIQTAVAFCQPGLVTVASEECAHDQIRDHAHAVEGVLGVPQ